MALFGEAGGGNGATVVVALGGNAVSPPAGDPSILAERAAVARAAAELASLANGGAHLLVVHGNGPQVGRLLAMAHGDEETLDVHVAQSQGELGYLLAEGLEAAFGAPAIALLTRVLVDPSDPAFRTPSKPIGPTLDAPGPHGVWSRTPDARGWRRVVASPRPRAVLEAEAIRGLLPAYHVIAGGGGGVPLACGRPPRCPQPAVVDKDWVASHLAIALHAERLVFVTDVPQAFDAYGAPDARPIATMSTTAARRRLVRGVFGAGSMAPKVESAVAYVEATGRPALITALGGVAAALAGTGGTVIQR